MKIIYSNISGGFIFAGQTYGEMLFSKVSLENYIEYFREKDADIISLSEVHLEDKTNSQMVEYMAKELDMPYHSSLALDSSHLDTNKRMGMAIISRYPIIDQEELIIPSPGIEVVRPNGEHWKMLDKGGQRVNLQIDNKIISIINFSYFPFHHFNRRLDDPEFSDVRQQLIKILLGKNEAASTIITGDFNNKNIKLDIAFPELFTDNLLAEAVQAQSTVIGYDEQLDHILYQPRFYKAENQFVELNGSDHLAIGAELKPIEF
ncbi:MAG TPA: endonuclease/exonuclease/phosphatase family protein [Candidatus Saccharimonadales bacterium]|nr:endonuclease/exonuclease/phosphatase family protein [Candidatus Saccharimonadales bacterium]